MNTSNQINLRHNKSSWNSFAGAERFPDGTEPFFAETAFDLGFSEDCGAVVILSAGEHGHPNITIQAADAELVWTASKTLLGWSWVEAKRWAERHITIDDTRRELAALGFNFEEV